jgi:hypothetical protein
LPVLPIVGAPEPAAPDEIVEHHAAGGAAKAEQTRGLREVKRQSGHVLVASDDEGFQHLPVRFTQGVSAARSALLD